MCTQTLPESEVVHAIYLRAPSHTWYAAITEPDRKDTKPDLTGHEPNTYNKLQLTDAKHLSKLGLKYW